MTARQSRLIRNIIIVAAALCVGFVCRDCADRMADRRTGGQTADVTIERDTIWSPDTILVFVPTPGETRMLRDTIVIAAIAHADTDTTVIASTDSAAVSLPVVSRHYGDSLFDAWVSGPVDPRLDSLRVYPRSMIVKETLTKTRGQTRWGLSVGAGLVASPKGVAPGVFAGITYTIKSF